MATAPSPNDLTRQQLDELDALLQRMLSLPLNPPETPAPKAAEPPPPALPPVAPNWRVDVPAAPAPHLRLTVDPLPLPDPIPAPAPERPPVVPHAAPEPERAPLRVAATPPERAEPERAPLRVAAKPSKHAEPERATPQLSPPTPTAVAPPTPWHLVPLVAVDRLVGVLGPVGRLVRSGFGRTLFGVAGLALLAYTAVHVAQVQGWLALPVPLPWPK